MCDELSDPFLIAEVFRETLFSIKTKTPNHICEIIEGKSIHGIDKENRECRHTNIAKDETCVNVCSDCGMEFKSLDFSREWRSFGAMDNRSTRDQSRCHKQKSTPKGIRSVFDMHKIDISNALIDTVEAKFNKIIEKSENKLFRGEGREALIVLCLFFAYQDNEDYRPVEYVRNLFNVSQKNMSSAMTLYYNAFPEDITKHVTPEKLIPWYMFLTGVGSEHYTRIISISKYLSATSQLIERSNPQSVAAATIYFYLCLFPEYKNELGLSKLKFAKKAELSDITISKIVKNMAEISAIAAEDWKYDSEKKATKDKPVSKNKPKECVTKNSRNKNTKAQRPK
jgi:transcription initiation factor TFIIIB Brf1 subunit/transcription initiation factor TFIIB